MKEKFHLESQSIQGVARSVDASGVPKIGLQFDMRAQPEYGSDVRVVSVPRSRVTVVNDLPLDIGSENQRMHLKASRQRHAITISQETCVAWPTKTS